MSVKVRKLGFFLFTFTVVLAAAPCCESRAEASDWKKRFKNARYIVFSWDGSISRYQLGLLQDSLTGEMVDNLINWREKANRAVAELHGCPPRYEVAREVLQQIFDLLSKQEALCTGKEHVMAHIKDWRSNKERVKQLHRKLDGLLNL